MKSARIFSILLGDIVMLAGSFFVTLVLRHRQYLTLDTIDYHIAPFALLYILWLIVFYIFNLYEIHSIKPNFVSMRQIVLALATSGIAGFLMFYFIPYFGITPKTTMILNVGVFGVLFVLWRTLYYHLFAYRFQKSIAIIGMSPESALLVDEITRNRHIGYKYVGNFETLQAMKNANTHPDIIVLGRTLATNELMELSEIKADTIRIMEAFQKMFYKIPVSLIVDTTATKIIEQEESHLYKITRRTVEIVFALVVLVATSPIILFTALAILIEDGRPVFYTQKRVGKKKKTFSIIKFRSMTKNAEKNGAQWADTNDSRVTKVGRIIRKLHIDEIPQMINILKGDIALVGPRPERPEFVSKLEESVPYYFLRHTAKPGFTGWAQIKFRYARTELDSKEKFEYDLYYIRNKNFFLDIGIILKTIQIIFTH
jgi:exopolysaccharide biosynthesis polyprenyl glycosylphosphotransferase